MCRRRRACQFIERYERLEAEKDIADQQKEVTAEAKGRLRHARMRKLIVLRNVIKTRLLKKKLFWICIKVLGCSAWG